ncbi:MAG: hypothetical protein WBO23_06855 [Burkholderiales bacterium]
MIRKPEAHSTSPSGRARALTTPAHQGRKWALACLLLLAVTWMPVFGVHLYRTSLADRATGTVVVVFPPMLGSRELFRSVSEASGSLVRPVRWFPRMWVASSAEPGFAGRLRERGAWAVHSTELLSARALLTCLQPGGSPAASAAPEPLPAS